MTRISELVRQAHDIKSEEVKIPEWGCSIEVRGLNGHGRSDYLLRLFEAREIEDSAERQTALANVEASLIISCSYDPEDGSKAFDEGDESILMDKAAWLLAGLSSKAIRLSGLDEDAEERLGKDSSESVLTVSSDQDTPSDDSTSTSVLNSVE